MRNKKGELQYDIIMYFILGLMILSIGMFFIFNEYFTEDELSLEICRQSIQVRSNLPDPEIAKIKVSFKDSFPLKCKTQVENIEKEDIEDIEKAKEKIASTIAMCWALYDRGDISAFPSKFYGSVSTCVPCARIHLTEDAKKSLNESGKVLNIREALDLRMKDGMSYYNYLQNSGKSFSAFNFGNRIPFDLEREDGDGHADVFDVWSNVEAVVADGVTRRREEGVVLMNRLNGAQLNVDSSVDSVILPENFDVDSGDLLINYGVVVFGKDDFEYVPYLFYFQAGQKKNPFLEVNSRFVENTFFCESWEGIPA